MSLATTDLRVGYGKRDVLQGIDLEIPGNMAPMSNRSPIG